MPAPDIVSLPVPAFLVSPTVTNSTSPSPSLPPSHSQPQPAVDWHVAMMGHQMLFHTALGSGHMLIHMALESTHMLIHMALESGHMLIHMALESAHIH